MKISNILFAACMVASGIMGGLAGGAIRDHQIHAAEEDAWSDVLVVRGGTLIANPAAMTPAELADSQLIKKAPQYIAFCNDKAYVGDSFDIFDPRTCKEISGLDQAQAEAKTFEVL